ncbi:MAG: ABC transporter substrate-binding protein [Myxococcales bacterium]|nr:ABC transporter substrate-binding protein [Myxococcales bacterium]
MRNLLEIKELRRLSLAAALLASAVSSAQVSADFRRALLAPFLEDRWDAIISLARAEGEVRWWMWNGDRNTNLWVDEFAARRMWELYGIRLRRVGVDHPSVFMDRLAEDMKKGVSDGAIDVVWLNGENFRTARRSDLLWGPFAHHLPNYIKYSDPAAQDIAYDFGFPTNGFETVYGRAQLVVYYDGARLKTPPTNLVQLVRWVRQNPGRFTYPEVNDHTGSGFVRNVFYHTNSTGGWQAFMGKEFDAELVDRAAATTWAYLNGLKPYLWQQGQRYPKTVSELDDMFQKGEVDFTISYSPLKGANMVKVKAWPPTVRGFVLAEGTLRNANFVAIPFNAKNKAAALVLANMVMSPEFQILSGTMMGIEYSKLSEKQQDIYRGRVGGNEAAIPPEVLDKHALPELTEEYVRAIEKGWRDNVGSSGG